MGFALEKMSYFSNVALLVKEELVFEIQSRGSVPAGEVITLRRQLRDLLAGGAEAEWPEGVQPSQELGVVSPEGR